MFKKLPVAILLLLLAISVVAGCSGTDDPLAPTVGADVDEYVKALPTWEEFSPPRVSENELVSGPVDTTRTHENRDYDCSVSRYSITETPREITVFSPDSEILWLGALLQGSKYAAGLGSLGELPVRQRAPLKVFIDLLTEDVTRTVASPDAASVAVAVGDLIEQASNSGHVAGSTIFFDQKTTHSLQQAALDMGISVNYLDTQVQSSLSFDQTVEEHTMTAYFTQKMFTVSMVLPQTPSEIFSQAFTDERLAGQVSLGRIGPDDVPTYGSSSTCGGMLMLTMTSSYSVEEMRAALYASRESIGGGSISGEHLTVLDNSRLRISTVGGADEGVEALITSGQLSTYFAADAPLTSARPLSYTVRNAADNSIAVVSETTEYAINSCAPAARPVIGARYRITVDKLEVTDLGCDGPIGASPEVYYSFDMVDDSGTVSLASVGAGGAVRVGKGEELSIASLPREFNLYDPQEHNGYTLMRLTGTVWDEDSGSSNDTIGTWNISYAYGLSTGQKTFSSSGRGCGVDIFVTVTKVRDLYD